MTRSRFLSFLTGLLLAVVLSGPAAAASPPPRLVVMIVVDGLPQRQVLAYRDQLAPDGLARFLERGAWFAQAHHVHAFTVTAPGHATLLTGATPSRTGIIGNEWRDPGTGAGTYCTADTGATYIGHKTQPLDGTSPRKLKVETVGDVLRAADARAKVIAISGKDRGAILPAGERGTAYMYMSDSGQFASTTYYMPSHPRWVAAFNARKPADRYFRTQWKPLLPEAAYARSVPDNAPWYPRGGALPMTMGAAADKAPGPAFYSALLRGPFADELTLAFARAAIAGEHLGRDDVPDILSISLSGHDYVNHAWSAESRLSHDHLLRLDRMLQGFLRHLDATVGKDRYLAVLTADHGFTPSTEFSRQQGIEAGQVDFTRMLARINAGLAERFGEGRWAIGYSAASLLLDRRLIANQHQDADAVAEEARKLLLDEPGVAVAYTQRELKSGSRAGEPYFAALRASWHPEVSGQVQFALRQDWTFASRSAAATHGSPYAYDTQVPLMFYGPRWVKPGRMDERVVMVDLAPTLSAVLGIAAPAASEGRALTGSLR